MSQTLNNKQRKLVEENHNLIYSFLNSRHLSLDAIEDWYGTAAVGLCKAALIYDESRGAKFTTLAYICMDNEVRMILRTNRKNVSVTASLNDEITATEGSCSLGEIIPDDHNFYCSVYLNDAIDIAARKLSERDKKFIDLIIIHGMTNIEIAKQFGVSQTTVSRVYRKFVKSVKDCFNG